MSLLHDVYAAYLAGLTTKKNDKEIWWKGDFNIPCTIEPAFNGAYFMRRYWDNGVHYMVAYYNEKDKCESCCVYNRAGEMVDWM